MVNYKTLLKSITPFIIPLNVLVFNVGSGIALSFWMFWLSLGYCIVQNNKFLNSLLLAVFGPLFYCVLVNAWNYRFDFYHFMPIIMAIHIFIMRKEFDFRILFGFMGISLVWLNMPFYYPFQFVFTISECLNIGFFSIFWILSYRKSRKNEKK